MAIHRARPAYLGLAIAVSLLFSTAALADSNVRITRLSYAEGDVRLDRGDGRGFELAVMNMPVANGNRVWTRNDALAEVEFEDGDSIRLTPETLLILHELSLRSNGTRVSLVELQEGEAYFNLRRDDDNDFRILVPGGELSLRKSSRLRISVRAKQLDVAVLKGEVELVGSGERLIVKKGETLNIDPNDAERYFLSRKVDSSSYDQWDKDRESYRDSYATNYNYGSYGSGGYSPYYSYGLSDLNYYGGYFNHPSYGWLWRPYYVNFGWSPFDNGAWVYYPGYGYIWVSAYPWGWIPYRYGSWYYVGGYGWCWRRGHRWDRWNSFTDVHHAPRNFRQPVVPQDKGTGIVNVGRGPRPIFPDTDRGDRGAPGRNRAEIRPVDPMSRGGKGFGDRGGITPRLPQAGDPNSEVVGKRSSGQPIVFPSNSGNNDGIRRVETDISGGISKRRDSSDAGSSTDLNRGRSMDRDSSSASKSRSAAVDTDNDVSEPVRGRTMDRDSGSGRKSLGSDSGRSNFRDASSGSTASTSGSSPSRSHSPAPSSGSRSSGGSSGSTSRGNSFSGGSSGGGSRSTGGGGSSGGASKGSSSSSRGTTR